MSSDNENNIKKELNNASNKIVGMCTIGRVEGISNNCRPFSIIENVVVKDSFRSKGQ